MKKVPYIKQTNVGGLYDFGKGKFTKTWIPNATLKGRYKIRTSGCGPCVTAMAIYYALGKFVNPATLNAMYNPGHGSAHSIVMYECKKRGIYAKFTTNVNDVTKALEDGCIVESVQGPGIFTKNGHFILLIDYIRGRIWVNDPASVRRTARLGGKTYTPAEVDKNVRRTSQRYTIVYPHPLVTVRKGDKGEDVRRWQLFLKWKGYGVKCDGAFGTITESATKAYQHSKGLSQDGIAGRKTRGKAVEDYGKA